MKSFLGKAEPFRLGERGMNEYGFYTNFQKQETYVILRGTFTAEELEKLAKQARERKLDFKMEGEV